MTIVDTKPMRKYSPGQFEVNTLPDDPEYRQAIVFLCRETGEMASNPEYIRTVSMLPGFVKLGPTPGDRVRMAAYYADEMRHGYIFEGLLTELGEDTTDGSEYTSIEALNLMDSIDSWENLAVFNTLLDRGGGIQLLDYVESSYAPLQRVGAFTGRDERGHAAMGLEHLRAACETAEGRDTAQKALDFWYPTSLDMFGSKRSKRQYKFIEFGLKTKLNEELRQEFIREVESFMPALGLVLPDPDLNRNRI